VGGDCFGSALAPVRISSTRQANDKDLMIAPRNSQSPLFRGSEMFWRGVTG